jgi:hydrogenase nickel incorporation protein HypA/HybF
MHELSIALSILDVAEEQGRLHGDAKVLAVHVRIGPLSGVIKDALVGAFELAREGSSMPECQLVVEETSIVVGCPACNENRTLQSMQEMRCPVCSAPTREVISGRELEVSAMELSE